MSGVGAHRAYLERNAARTFPARYAGRCPSCGTPIGVGDLLRFDEDDQAVHADCSSTVPGTAVTTEVCSRCRETVAVSGACGCEA